MTLHSTDDFLHLSDTALERLGIPPADLADAVEAALIAKAKGRLHVTPKSAVLPGGGRYMMSTLAVGDEGLTVLKTVAVCPDNPARGLPTINGAIMVLDAETGFLKAVMGANWITAHRTAALSAVAARRLADPASAAIALPLVGLVGFLMLGDGGQTIASNALRAVGDAWPATFIHLSGYLCLMVGGGWLLAIPLERHVQGLLEATALASFTVLFLLSWRFWHLTRPPSNVSTREMKS